LKLTEIQLAVIRHGLSRQVFPFCGLVCLAAYMASSAAWPLHFPKATPCGLLVFDFGAAFSILDKRSRGAEFLEGAYSPLRNPESPRN
jgi:hypothetical protein